MKKFNWQEGNSVELLINGEEFFPKVFDTIRSARTEVLIETFIIFSDVVGLELKDALLKAAANGVRVVLTVDGYGTANLDKEYTNELAQAGIHMQIFDPRPRLLGMRTNLFRRLHRKIVVVDGETAFLGGINFGADHLAAHGAGSKQDYAVQVRGPIVADIHKACLATLDHTPAAAALPALKLTPRFAGKVRMLLAIRDNENHRNDIEDQYIRGIRGATYRLILANAYFFPGYRLLRELRSAARRGVQVTLIMQGKPDMSWVQMFTTLLYNYLLREGVVIWEYHQRPLHGKVALADREWTTIGSSNLDPLSMSLNLEANLVIRDPDFNQQLFDHLTELVNTQCLRVTPQLAARGYWWRAPLIFLSFHFLRHFPAIAGWLPAHTQKVQAISPDEDTPPAPLPDKENS
jgi:cardiolipin synthase A/B